jgi:N-dimethylarginine dimethylaminohydrolase
MINQKILISSAEYFSNRSPINPYYKNEDVSIAKAAYEHQTLEQAFRQAGVEVVKVPAPSTSQDGVYAANWALVRGKKAVIANLPNARRSESAYAAKILRNLGYEVIRLPRNLKFSGQGDALPCGKYLLAGSGYRSDPEAQALVAAELGLELVQLHAVPKLDDEGNPLVNDSSGWPDSFFYDLDLAVAVLRDDLIAYCPEALDAQSRAKIAALPLEKIEVSLDEARQGFACNLLSIGETVVMSSHAPQLQSALEQRGLKTILIDAPELKKGGGYIRCVSLTLE